MTNNRQYSGVTVLFTYTCFMYGNWSIHDPVVLRTKMPIAVAKKLLLTVAARVCVRIKFLELRIFTLQMLPLHSATWACAPFPPFRHHWTHIVKTSHNHCYESPIERAVSMRHRLTCIDGVPKLSCHCVTLICILLTM